MDHRPDKAAAMAERLLVFGHKTYTRLPGVDLRRNPHLLNESQYVFGAGKRRCGTAKVRNACERWAAGSMR